MIQNRAVRWRGKGRWFSLAGAGLLIVLAVIALWIALGRVGATGIELELAAGWDLFLGLILVGTVMSGTKRAPILTMIVAILMLIRVVSGIVAGRPLLVLLVDIALMILLSFAAIDLRRQAKIT